jgi:3-vinyl bacteriochlorophyllide hydratase
MGAPQGKGTRRGTLYTEDQRHRRDTTRWTLVQGILAPLQFVVFLVSLGLVIRYLLTGNGFEAATASVIIKTLVLYAIMVTGAIWEKVVFGKYLFADAFFWEDVVSMLVIALHTAYLAAWLSGWGTRPTANAYRTGRLCSLCDQRSTVSAQASHGAAGGRSSRTSPLSAARCGHERFQRNLPGA